MDESFGLRMRNQVFFWLGVFAFFILFMWVFADILLPFIAGMALAYFLDPVADWLERKGLSRIWATTNILIGFILLFIMFLMILLPVLANQIAGFLERLPELVAKLQQLMSSTQIEWLRQKFGVDGSSIQENINSLMKEGAGWLSTILTKVWGTGKSLVDIASLLVVTPVVAFYLLYDWDHMVERIDKLLPHDHRATVRSIMSDIDVAVAGFVRGQGMVCLILGLFYGASLTIIGLNFGLLIGLFAGLISFVPFVGSIIGFILSVGVALVQFWPDWIPVVLCALTFFLGQFIEGNILQPKLVGNKVGLHPVWLMFALFAFGSLFGFTGMLVAVPAAAAVGVVIRFGISRYLESDLYKGNGKESSAKKSAKSGKKEQPAE